MSQLAFVLPRPLEAGKAYNVTQGIASPNIGRSAAVMLALFLDVLHGGCTGSWTAAPVAKSSAITGSRRGTSAGAAWASAVPLPGPGPAVLPGPPSSLG